MNPCRSPCIQDGLASSATSGHNPNARLAVLPRTSTVRRLLFGVVGGAVIFGVLGRFLGRTLWAVGYESIQEWNALEAATPS